MHALRTLRVPVTSFVGRSREIRQLTQLLAASRLVTLLGMGGIGKSRLALEVARATLGTVVQEASVVELVDISDPLLVPRAVATALGVRDGGERPIIQQLETALSSRSLLLVLDNCEHVAGAVAGLARELLERCPGLRVLATSRVPLDLSGESRWSVEPLTVPSLDRPLARASVIRYSAVQLFVARAEAARPSFRLTDDNAADIVRICHRLDGIPLALELAAVRISVLHPRQLLDRLADRFGVLGNSSSDAHIRHRTLRDLIDWSHDLLSPAEQCLFRRLAVFVGGWTLEAAEAVCADEGLPHTETLNLLSQLIAHSLVQTEQGHSEMRFRFLDTIRDYALGQLRDVSEEDVLRQRHFLWVQRIAAAADEQLWTSEQRACLERLTCELENLRAALTWSTSLPAGVLDGDAELRIVTSLWRFWEQRGLGREGLSRVKALLDRQPGHVSAARVVGLAMVAFFAYVQGDPAAAVVAADTAIAHARQVGDQRALVLVLLPVSLLHGARGDLVAAEAGLQEALAISREIDFGPGARMAIQNLAVARRLAGDQPRAVAYLQEGLALCVQAGDNYTEAFYRLALGHIALQSGDLDGSGREFGRVATIMRDLEDVQNVSMAVEGLGWTASAAGGHMDAARLLGAAEGMRERVGAVVLPHWAAEHTEAIARSQSALGEGRFARAWAAGRSLAPAQAITLGLRRTERGSAGGGPASPVPNQDKGAVLSRREREVAGLVAQGLTNRQIAEQLVLQESTVGNHLQRIYARLGLSGRAQLAAWISEQARGRDTSG